MSVLTKIFVVLLVVVSLLMASGMVVFVNRVENFTEATKKAQASETRALARAQAAEQEAVASRGDRDARILEADARSMAYRAALDAKISEVAGVQAQLVTEQTARAKAETEAQAAVLAAQGALKTVDAQQKVINDTAAKLTSVEKLYTETQTRVAQLTQEGDGLKATVRRLREDVVARDEQIEELRKLAGRSVAATDTTTAGGRETTLNLRGVVKAKRNINGIEYATISLGAADNVTKGMKFKVINRSNFLGYLVIDSVEPNEAVGHLEGPNLTLVGPGSEVRTQW
ncbi:hypothetical protein [Humisphaera borealis]|uniref:Uncharacterized protein n=1 Tax=Humisphaera borealis TaxID=2807512 RepID=A0A7M2WZI4_9BACT|nr:hypothetical protein [Humisphaera borealis]QOV90927.1 hypothetical protein IPV69_06080 [Humisphaera borealis]